LYGDIPNRHENLFSCGRRGIALSKIIMQSMYLLSLLCMASQLVYNLKHLYKMPSLKNYEAIELSLLIVSHIGPVILMVVIWFSILPIVLTKMTLVTNIEMMKDA